MPTYFLGINHIRRLLSIGDLSACEKKAISRLSEFNGTEDDIDIAARLYDSINEHEIAKKIREEIDE